MKITARVEYASMAVFELALRGRSRRVQARELAESQQIPLKFLEQILIQLKNAGLVKSVRGAAGGYNLSKPAAQISLLQVVEAVEGEVSLLEQRRQGDPTVLRVWQEIESEFLQKLASISIQDLINRKIREDQVIVYHI